MKGHIYILMFPSGKWYIGSTTKKYISSRIHGHKVDFLKGVNSSLYKYLREVGWNALTYEIIETIEVNTINELRNYEQKYIETHKNDDCLNDRSAFTGLTKSEYNKNYAKINKQQIIQYHQAYREAHREEHKEYMKVYNRK